MKRFIKFILLSCTFLFMQMTCYNNVDGHQYFVVKNQTDETIYVWDSFLYLKRPFGRGGEIFPAPNIKIKGSPVPAKKSLPIDILYDDSWENIFKRRENKRDSIVVYIGSKETDQVYILGYEDLVSLDFSFSYPPNPDMKNVRMIPSYEDAARGKTLQDIDLGQEEMTIVSNANMM